MSDCADVSVGLGSEQRWRNAAAELGCCFLGLSRRKRFREPNDVCAILTVLFENVSIKGQNKYTSFFFPGKFTRFTTVRKIWEKSKKRRKKKKKLFLGFLEKEIDKVIEITGRD